MPAYPSPGPVLKVRWNWKIGEDSNAANVLHYQYSGGAPTSVDCAAMAGHAAASFVGAYQNFLVETTILESIEVIDLSSNTGQEGVYSPNTPGSSGGPAVPGNTCVLQSLKVNTRYRGGHPRQYWPGGDTAFLQDPQSWSAVALAEITPALLAMATSLQGYSSGSTDVTSQCAVSYWHAHAIRPVPLIMPIIGWTVQAKIATQRRRIRKV